MCVDTSTKKNSNEDVRRSHPSCMLYPVAIMSGAGSLARSHTICNIYPAISGIYRIVVVALHRIARSYVLATS